MPMIDDRPCSGSFISSAIFNSISEFMDPQRRFLMHNPGYFRPEWVGCHRQNEGCCWKEKFRRGRGRVGIGARPETSTQGGRHRTLRGYRGTSALTVRDSVLGGVFVVGIFLLLHLHPNNFQSRHCRQLQLRQQCRYHHCHMRRAR